MIPKLLNVEKFVNWTFSKIMATFGENLRFEKNWCHFPTKHFTNRIKAKIKIDKPK